MKCSPTGRYLVRQGQGEPNAAEAHQEVPSHDEHLPAQAVDEQPLEDMRHETAETPALPDPPV